MTDRPVTDEPAHYPQSLMHEQDWPAIVSGQQDTIDELIRVIDAQQTTLNDILTRLDRAGIPRADASER